MDHKGVASEISNLQEMHIANSIRQVTFYDLEMIISGGYRG